ncbi:MAG TPA: magnesium/cobalt transporter CorA [Bryobacteraceae bacterium]|nr:magnesium/cobalt transporter CorA [Bryobacteraceae bacterium]
MSDEAQGLPGEAMVEWHEIRDPADPQLDRLAERYGLHPLHIEDCRHRDQRAKIEELDEYIFIVLKPVECGGEAELEASDLDIFLGPNFVITVQEGNCVAVARMLSTLRTSWGTWTRGDQLLYRIMDGVVDSYLPTIDGFSDTIDELEDAVLDNPTPEALQRIFAMKRALVLMRRVLGNTRDVAGHLQRTANELIAADLWPFLRDVYDHVTRNLDTIETQRDLLNGALDIYLSSVSNRMNSVMKTLTIVGTIALPAIIITGMYGMNVEGLPYAHSPYAFGIVGAAVGISMILLLLILKRLHWF